MSSNELFDADGFEDLSEGVQDGDWVCLYLALSKQTRTIIVSAEMGIRYQFGRWEEQVDCYVEELSQRYHVKKLRLRRLTDEV